VEVRHGKQLPFPFFNPLFFGHRLALWTVAVATGVVRRSLPSATKASVEMPVERGGATDFEQVHEENLQILTGNEIAPGDPSQILEIYSNPIHHLLLSPQAWSGPKAFCGN